MLVIMSTQIKKKNIKTKILTNTFRYNTIKIIKLKKINQTYNKNTINSRTKKNLKIRGIKMNLEE